MANNKTLSERIVDSAGTGKSDPAELTVLDSITASADEINLLDGVTASTAELNILDGVTATAAEINLKCDDGQRAVTNTADGLTTGLILATDNTIVVTSGSVNNIITLPAIATVPLGWQVKIFTGSPGTECRTVAGSTTTINNVDSSGGNEAAIPANAISIATKTSATNYILECYLAAGTRSIPIPDA